ncbi:hypothetical protein [Prescottella equi]
MWTLPVGCCRSLVGKELATSDYQRSDQTTALRIFAAVESDEAAAG